jgi:DnaK suppressor protein
MIGEITAERTRTLRKMLSRLQEEGRQRIGILRSDRRHASHSRQTDAMNASAVIQADADKGDPCDCGTELKHLVDALARLEAGNYGQCQTCGGAISIERLTAIPFASYCADCQKTLNRVRGGWGHEPSDDQWT